MSANKAAQPKQKRSYVSQTDVPRVSLVQALRVPRALADEYGKKPARPLDVAAALGITPTSSGFRDLCGAAIGYGVTDGGVHASEISLTQLGLRIVAPLEEGDDERGMREAALVPTVVRNFLEKYDGSPLPAEKIGWNVLETMGVPAGAAERVLSIIIENAKTVGFLKVIKDKTFVDIGSGARAAPRVAASDQPPDPPDVDHDAPETATLATSAPRSTGVVPPSASRNRKVFVSHGKSRRVVDQLKELLTLGNFEPVVSVDHETVSKPVPQKVLDDMRSCGAGIIHVKPEERFLDTGGEEHRILNQNVLIEIGAAVALYGEHFILLVEQGTTLPSNLQGLYEVRYSGDELGYEATMKVLKALNQFKSGQA